MKKSTSYTRKVFIKFKEISFAINITLQSNQYSFHQVPMCLGQLAVGIFIQGLMY